MDPERDAMVKAAAERIRRRYRALSERASARRVRAQEFARELAGRLAATDERVEKIIGFGSTFETWRNYRLDSDIDLGVVGGDWFKLTSVIPASEFDVSIVELDLQDEEFRQHVLTHGETLYEKR